VNEHLLLNQPEHKTNPIYRVQAFDKLWLKLTLSWIALAMPKLYDQGLCLKKRVAKQTTSSFMQGGEDVYC